MVSTINIRRDVNDVFYRYKMPKLISKIEGKGNGIRTVVPNMSDIAKSLTRPPTYVTKFFGCELGAQVKCDEKHDKYVVNGAHDAEKLQNLLDGFIQKFVLCGSCKNPETDLLLTGGIITRVCQACGKRTEVDMRHRLTAFILKNPPQQKKKAYRKRSSSGAASPSNSDSKAESGRSDDEITQQITNGIAELPERSSLAEDDWAEDTSAEAVAARKKELASGLKNDLIEQEVEEDNLTLEEFKTFFKENPSISYEELMQFSSKFTISESKQLIYIVESIFDENIVKQLPEKQDLLAKLVKGEKQQKCLLGALEHFIGNVHRNLLSNTSVILMTFYQADLIEEEVFLEWEKKRSKKYVDKETSKLLRKNAKHFLNWLHHAEEDEEDEDEFEGDGEGDEN